MNKLPLTSMGAIYSGLFQTERPNSKSSMMSCPQEIAHLLLIKPSGFVIAVPISPILFISRQKDRAR
jgi:hypothetical protein